MEDILALVESYANVLNLTPHQYVEQAVREKIKAGNKTSYPEDFTITAEMHQWFDSKKFTFDIYEATEEWATKMHSKPNRYKYSNWKSAWQNGMIKHNQWRAQNGRKPKGSAAYEDFKARPRTAIEEAQRIRQAREAGRSPRAHHNLH